MRKEHPVPRRSSPMTKLEVFRLRPWRNLPGVWAWTPSGTRGLRETHPYSIPFSWIMLWTKYKAPWKDASPNNPSLPPKVAPLQKRRGSIRRRSRCSTTIIIMCITTYRTVSTSSSNPCKRGRTSAQYPPRVGPGCEWVTLTKTENQP